MECAAARVADALALPRAGASDAPPATERTLAARIGQGIEDARALEREAHSALSALHAGERGCEVEGVLLATRKADAAFQMLQAVRNAMIEAYAEIREMRL